MEEGLLRKMHFRDLERKCLLTKMSEFRPIGRKVFFTHTSKLAQYRKLRIIYVIYAYPTYLMSP